MKHDEGIALSNGIRLSGREWILVAVFGLAIVIGAPLWASREPLDVPAEARIPSKLSDDYWLYRRYAERAAKRGDIVVLGDSVVGGKFAHRGETLSHSLNALAGGEKYANLGLNGAHPLALAGLVEHFATPIAGMRVVLHCNPLWYTSDTVDLRDPKKTEFNHPRLVPQFDFRMTSLDADVSTRLGSLVLQRLPFSQWTTHLQQSHYEQSDIPGWTLNNPYADPIAPALADVVLDDDRIEEQQASWKKRGVQLTDYAWIDPDDSLQWPAFQRTVELLRKRGNAVFVLVGPFNEHLLTDDSRRRYAPVKAKLAAWLTLNGIPHVTPEALSSELYGDSSHPLPAGYAALAKTLWETASFRSFK
jgi:hypothetical protein